MNKADIIKAGTFGVVVGDALGVPVEFTSRSERRADPVTDLREYGTYKQPKGSWSDDSSMMLATMDSMIQCSGIRYDDIMEKFVDWAKKGAYTPAGVVFDIGISCSKAISRYRPGVNPLSCGGTGERDNGNGSLMRIMPLSLWFGLKEDFWDEAVFEKAVEEVHNVSRLTHAHPRSMIGCMLYTAVCHELIFRAGRTAEEAVAEGLRRCFEYYDKAGAELAWYNDTFAEEIKADVYGRMRDLSAFKELPDPEIKSTGYVVASLEAAIWCLLNTGSFSSCVLKAVNLGDDTDTVAAIAGGLAGLAYGFEGIPEKWVDAMISVDRISDLCYDFAQLVK